MGIFNIFKKAGSSQYKTAAQRKAETEALLKSLTIPVNIHLPLIEEEKEVSIRSALEIAERILILSYLVFALEVPSERQKIIDYLKASSLWDKVSPIEKELFQKEALSNQEKANISWRSECIWLLLWVTQKVDILLLPTSQIESSEIIARLPGLFEKPGEFISKAVTKSATAILDLSDLTYRLHWAARDADLKNQPMPANLDLSVIMERHYAINWVTCYADEWDEITTDT